jgi:hypothetical protein
MQSTTQKTKDWATQPYKHRSSQRISSSCSTNNNIKDSTTAVFVVFEWNYLSAFNTIVSLGRMSEWLMCCLTPIEQYSNYSMASLGVSFHDNKPDHCIICEGCILRASGKHLHDFVILLRTSFWAQESKMSCICVCLSLWFVDYNLELSRQRSSF